MITDSFDTSKPLISPEMFFKKSNVQCDICIITFSDQATRFFCDLGKTSEVRFRNNSSGENSIFITEYSGVRFAVLTSQMGAVAASMNLLAASQVTGATQFISLGTAGSLDISQTKGKIIVPTQAYRDEGLSYHYAPASDYITVKNSGLIKSVLDNCGIPVTYGKVWTTDAVFMETEKQCELRRKDGCIAVDMEISALQAVCDYYGFEYFPYLFTGDVLNTSNYQKGDLGTGNKHSGNLIPAVEIVKRISR